MKLQQKNGKKKSTKFDQRNKPKDVFNANENRLSFYLLPDKSYVAKADAPCCWKIVQHMKL